MEQQQQTPQSTPNEQTPEMEIGESSQVSYVDITIMKKLEESFSKIQTILSSKEEEKDKTKKIDYVLNYIVKEMKKSIKRKDEEELNVSWMITKIEENLSESKKLSKSKSITQSPLPFPRPLQINIIENYMKLITYLLLFSKSSEANQLIKILFYCLFSTGLPKTVITKQLGFLFDVVEPNGESLLMNPLNILMIKLDSNTKRKSLQYLVEFYYYYRKDITPNFIDLISGTIECPTDSDKVINQVLVDYVIDFTFYMITESILDHYFVKVFKVKHQNTNTNTHNVNLTPPNILSNLFLLLMTYFMNGYNMFNSDKLKCCFLMLFICEYYEQRDGVGLTLSIGNIFINELKSNNTIIESVLEQLIELVNIDVCYDSLYDYLYNLISSLKLQMHFILDYSNEQVFQYQQMVNINKKKPINVLYLNKIDVLEKEFVSEDDYCYHEINGKYCFGFKKTIFKRAGIITEGIIKEHKDTLKDQKKMTDEIDKQIQANKKALLKITLDKIKYILFNILCKKTSKKVINEQAIISKYLLPLLNVLSYHDYSKEIYNNIVLDFIVYITKSKGSFIHMNEWIHIFNIVKVIYNHSNNSLNYNNEVCVLPFIYELKSLKFENKYKGNKLSLFNFISSIKLNTVDICMLLLQSVLAIEFNDNCVYNIQKIFYAFTGTKLMNFVNEEDNKEEDVKSIKSNMLTRLTPNTFKDIFKVILNYIRNLLCDIEYNKNNVEYHEKLDNELTKVNELLLFYSPLIVQFLVNVPQTQDYLIDLVNFIIDLCILYRTQPEFTNKLIKSILTVSSNDITITIYSLNKMFLLFSEHYLIHDLKAVLSFLSEKTNSLQSSNPFNTKHYMTFIEILEKMKISSDYTIKNLRLAIMTKEQKNNNDQEISFAYFDIVPLLDYLFKCYQLISVNNSESLFVIESRERLSLFFSESLYTNSLLFKFIDMRLLYEVFNVQLNDYIKKFDSPKQLLQIYEQSKTTLNILIKISFHLDIEQKFDVIDDYIKHLKTLIPHIRAVAERYNTYRDSNHETNKLLNSMNISLKSNTNTQNTSTSIPKSKNMGCFRTFLHLLNTLEVTMFSISSYNTNISKYTQLLKRSITCTLDICSEFIGICILFNYYQPVKFALFKLIFMIKEFICMYDDAILKTIYILLQISQYYKRLNDINKSFKDVIDKDFIQKLQHSLVKGGGLFKRKEYSKVDISSDLYFEVSCDYLMNYFIEKYPKKKELYKCFSFLSETEGDVKNNADINNKLIRDQILLQNVRTILEKEIDVRIDNEKMLDIKNANVVPSFYMEKNAFRFILSYVINENTKQIEVYIRAATLNQIKYIDINDLTFNNEKDVLQFIIGKLNLDKKTQLIPMSNDKSIIKMINSLDSLPTYRQLFCKIIYGKYENENEKEMLSTSPSEESFQLYNSFINALGTKYVDENNKTKIKHRDINNEIEFELYNPPNKKQQQISNPYKDDKVTLIWCEPIEIKLQNTLNELTQQQNKLNHHKMEQLQIEKAKDNNVFYIIIHPFTNSYFSVKIHLNEIKSYTNTFDRLFFSEVVIEAGKNFELICSYIRKMIVILNTLSSFLNFLEKNKTTSDKDVLEYILLNSDNLFNRFSQLNSLCHCALKKNK